MALERVPCCLVLTLADRWQWGLFTALEGGEWTLTVGSGPSVWVGRLAMRHWSPNVSSMRSQPLTGRGLPS